MLVTAMALAALAGSPDYLVTAVAKSHPAGGYVGASASYEVSDESAWRLGGYLNYYYYWIDAGLKADWEYLGRFLYFENWLGFEPGQFVFDGETSDRDLGFRGVARSRLTVNYRPSWYWLYSRSTVEGRLRNFTENDIYRDVTLRNELTLEQATAALFRIHEFEDKASLWAYAETTVLVEASKGLLDLRPSGGLMYENIIPGLTLNLDAYYGLKDGILRGFGALLFMWWQL
jgi:hypothetical protein